MSDKKGNPITESGILLGNSRDGENSFVMVGKKTISISTDQIINAWDGFGKPVDIKKAEQG